MKGFLATVWALALASMISCGSKIESIPIEGLPSHGTDGSTQPDPGNGSPVPTTCPTNFVKIPANTSLATSEFCFSKFEMKAALNDGTAVFDTNNSGTPLNVTLHKAESRPDGLPWIRITLLQASAECSSLGTGYHLATLKEWQAVALNVESVASNWSGNAVGSGTIIKGHSDGATSTTAVTDGYAVSGVALLAAGAGTDPYGGTGQTSGTQKRTHTLSNGEIIWDLSGNAREIVDPNGSASGVNYTGPSSASFYEVSGSELSSMLATLTFTSGAAGGLTADLFKPATPGLNHTTNEIGRVYINNGAQTNKLITRGGNFSSSNSPGIFAADFDSPTTAASGSASFRCVKSL